jgi:hypothetical protein
MDEIGIEIEIEMVWDQNTKNFDFYRYAQSDCDSDPDPDFHSDKTCPNIMLWAMAACDCPVNFATRG